MPETTGSKSAWQTLRGDLQQRGQQILGADREQKANLRLLGARAAIALLILVFHCVFFNLDRLDWRGWNVAGASMPIRIDTGIGLFFALSGFTLYKRWISSWQKGTTVSTRSYFLRRAGRILPLYWLTLSVALILILIGSSTPKVGASWPEVGSVWPFFLMLQNYFRSTFMGLSVVTWTLCIDVAFYASLPIIGFFASRVRSWNQQWMILLALLGAAIAWRFIGPTAANDRLYYTVFPFWLPFFIVGMMFALVMAKGTKFSIPPFATAGLYLLAFLVLYSEGFNDNYGDVRLGYGIAVVGVCLQAICLLFGSGPAVNWLASRLFVGLGILSYGIFLWQIPILLFYKLLGVQVGWLGTLLIVAPTTIILAAVTFVLVEMPSLRISHRWAKRFEHVKSVPGPVDSSSSRGKAVSA